MGDWAFAYAGRPSVVMYSSVDRILHVKAFDASVCHQISRLIGSQFILGVHRELRCVASSRVRLQALPSTVKASRNVDFHQRADRSGAVAAMRWSHHSFLSWNPNKPSILGLSPEVLFFMLITYLIRESPS